jgi:hypothetical protein
LATARYSRLQGKGRFVFAATMSGFSGALRAPVVSVASEFRRVIDRRRCA